MTFKMATVNIVVVFLVTVTVIHCLDEYDRINAHIKYDQTSDSYQIQDGLPEDSSLAWAQLIDGVGTSGWAYLEVNVRDFNDSGRIDDTKRAYAAGLVEGYITRDLIRQHWQNTRAGYCDQPLSPYCHRLRDFLQANLDWIRAAIKNNQDDLYWHQVDLFYTQLRGLTDGYHKDPKVPSLDIDPLGLYMFQISDDLGDLEKLLKKPGVQKGPLPGHCSALVKVGPDGQLFVSHNTWTSYTNMLRVLKRYNLPYGMTSKKQETIYDQPPGFLWSFSSYPGYLVSSDDFHVLSSYMVSMETTIPNDNSDLYVHTKPEGCLFEPVRVWVANILANNGAEWVGNFTRYNSGTYNNQWMIINYQKIRTFDMKILPGLLTIVEQLPGYTETADVTDVLTSQSYWASYNIAYFPKIFNMSGQQSFVDKYGDYFTHDMCRRAQIFRRDHNKVKDSRSLYDLMRYNDFKNDPLSRCNCTPPYSADLAIAARADLNSDSGSYPYHGLGFAMGGAIDMKMVAFNQMQWLQFDALSGPTNEQQPAFQWSKVKDSDKYPHEGHPDLFNFTPVSFNGTVVTPPFTPYWYSHSEDRDTT